MSIPEEILNSIEPEQCYMDMSVYEVAARDEMHPTRTVNTVYVRDNRTGVEYTASQRGFCHGHALTVRRGMALVEKYRQWRGQ